MLNRSDSIYSTEVFSKVVSLVGVISLGANFIVVTTPSALG